MDKVISHNIIEICKKLGIDYKSCNSNFVNFTTDAQLLGQLYKDLLKVMGKLQEIADRHNIAELKEIIKIDIEQLEAVDHDLVRLSTKLRKEYD